MGYRRSRAQPPKRRAKVRDPRFWRGKTRTIYNRQLDIYDLLLCARGWDFAASKRRHVNRVLNYWR